MLRDTKQRLTPVDVRRWALRCGGGLLLGAGICAAAAGTAHASDSLDLTGQARVVVDGALAPRSADSGTAAVTPAPAPGVPASTRIVTITPAVGNVGRHRPPEAVLGGHVARSGEKAAHAVAGGNLNSADKVSGRLADAVHPAPSRQPADGRERGVRAVPAVLDNVPALVRMPRVPGAPTVTIPEIIRPADGVRLPRVTLPALDVPLLGLRQLPGLNLPALNLPSLNLPGLSLPGLVPAPGRPQLLLPALPMAPGLSAPALAAPSGRIGLAPMTPQGLAGTASRHLSRVALPDAPSAPAAPRGPRPTGPVPALPAGTGAGVAVDLITAWAEPADFAGATPSGQNCFVTGYAGPAPRDRAGMPSITPD